MQTPRTVTDISSLDHSLTDVTDKSESDEDNYISNDLFTLSDCRLIFNHPVSRNTFWKVVKECGDLDDILEIDWSYQNWEDQILDDLALLRDQLAYFYLEDPWPDIPELIQKKKTYPNIVGLKVLNLLEVLTPLNLAPFLKLFPNLRWLHFARPTKNSLRRTSWLNLSTAKKIISQTLPNLALDIFD